MKIDVAEVRKCLKSFDFTTLFREHLGWDNHQAQLDITVGSETVHLAALAQKRGFVAFFCPSIPDHRATRLKIDREITKSVREHFVIYADEGSGQQIWQWVRREPGKPLASRDHSFNTSQSGDALIQRLDQIAVSIDEEETITIVDVAGHAKAAFDVDKVTKKFYDRFKAEHAAFLKLITGIKTDTDLQWYASLMLNRLMFIYFIQKKGFLDGDLDYLRNRLSMVRQVKGKDKFQSFYRYFLLRLFHDGLGKSPEDRRLDPVLEKLLGQIPYLDGGFFEVHQLEEQNPDIDIPDRAFEKLFGFFDQYSWHLDERPLRADNEINPDVVGYIFEKYINQKQMGAYYTKEDITEYISKNTIIPFLFDDAQKECTVAFTPESAVWRLLSDDPDRYIYPAVGHGITCVYDRINHLDHKRLSKPLRLPAEIEQGVNDVSKRNGWNKPAPEAYALPTETWREVVGRRQRCLDVLEKLRNGEVHQINDFVTLNLDIWQFARDAIVNAEGPELLRAFWHSIEKITVLDPTCGSGAFLFAALRILETLYSDCLERMERFVEDAEHAAPSTPEKQVRTLIAAGEGATVEFKASARWDTKENRHNPVLEGVIVKTVAGFLNGHGGTLLIGVSDNGVVIGLERDYRHTQKQNPSRDQFELWLTDYLMNKLGHEAKPYFHIDFAECGGSNVCRVTVYRSAQPVFVLKNGQEVLYVRQGNATKPYTKSSEIIAYKEQHWPADQSVVLPPSPPSACDVTLVKKTADVKRVYNDFRKTLGLIEKHPSDRYFILKTIIINNLFGVDIMEEAVEICRLRLFLKLVAQVEMVDQIEPLPDIDFNIQAGNTLVGYTTYDEVKHAVTSELDFDNTMEKIASKADDLQHTFDKFRQLQTEGDESVGTTDKQELQKRLRAFEAELNHHLAGEYGVKVSDKAACAKWVKSHQPFHWFIQFYGILNRGGFDVILGNPPYVAAAKARRIYAVKNLVTNDCTDIYAWVLERSQNLLRINGRTGMIVPLSLGFSGTFDSCRRLLFTGYSDNWFSSFGRIPTALFNFDVRVRNTIHVALKSERPAQNHSTRLHRWFEAARPELFQTIEYAPFEPALWNYRIPKLNTAALAHAFEHKLATSTRTLNFFTSQRATKHVIYFKKTAYNWLNFCREMPPCYDGSRRISHTQFDSVYFSDAELQQIFEIFSNGKLMMVFWFTVGDDFHVTRWSFGDFPTDLSSLSEQQRRNLLARVPELERAMDAAVQFKLNAGRRVGNYNLAKCRHATDQSDRILAEALGFADVWEDIELYYVQTVKTDFSAVEEE